MDFTGSDRVEARGGLVQEDDLGVVEQRPRQGDALAQALGKRTTRVRCPARHVHSFERRPDALGPPGGVAAAGTGPGLARERGEVTVLK